MNSVLNILYAFSYLLVSASLRGRYYDQLPFRDGEIGPELRGNFPSHLIKWWARIWFQAVLFWRRRQWHPTPVLLPGKSHGRRSLVGCSPWGREESGTTEQLHFHFSLWCIGEGNGNPLQCSCLENPRDGGAWWAAVYGVTHSQTQLKWLSSSSSFILESTHIKSFLDHLQGEGRN